VAAVSLLWGFEDIPVPPPDSQIPFADRYVGLLAPLAAALAPQAQLDHCVRMAHNTAIMPSRPTILPLSVPDPGLQSRLLPLQTVSLIPLSRADHFHAPCHECDCLVPDAGVNSTLLLGSRCTLARSSYSEPQLDLSPAYWPPLYRVKAAIVCSEETMYSSDFACGSGCAPYGERHDFRLCPRADARSEHRPVDGRAGHAACGDSQWNKTALD